MSQFRNSTREDKILKSSQVCKNLALHCRSYLSVKDDYGEPAHFLMTTFTPINGFHETFVPFFMKNFFLDQKSGQWGRSVSYPNCSGQSCPLEPSKLAHQPSLAFWIFCSFFYTSLAYERVLLASFLETWKSSKLALWSKTGNSPKVNIKGGWTKENLTTPVPRAPQYSRQQPAQEWKKSLSWKHTAAMHHPQSLAQSYLQIIKIWIPTLKFILDRKMHDLVGDEDSALKLCHHVPMTVLGGM